MKDKASTNLNPQIHSVYFKVPAVIGFQPVDHLDLDKFTLHLVQDFIMVTDKKDNTKYMIPLTNVGTIRLQ